MDGLVALIISNPTSLLIPNANNQWLLPVVCGLMLIALLLLVFLLLHNRHGTRIIEVLKIPLKPLPKAIQRKGWEILDQIAVFQTAGWRFHLAVASITTVDTLIGGVVTYILAARTANIAAPELIFVWLCAGIYIIGRLPITVANLGVREATLVGFLAMYNVEKPAALLMSMILFSALVAMAMIGAIYQISWAVAGKKSTPPPE
ncbi:lysylphosphatidylglycerol synthase domain-containing protein [Planctomycetota bacterium]